MSENPKKSLTPPILVAKPGEDNILSPNPARFGFTKQIFVDSLPASGEVNTLYAKNIYNPDGSLLGYLYYTWSAQGGFAYAPFAVASPNTVSKDGGRSQKADVVNPEREMPEKVYNGIVVFKKEPYVRGMILSEYVDKHGGVTHEELAVAIASVPHVSFTEGTGDDVGFVDEIKIDDDELEVVTPSKVVPSIKGADVPDGAVIKVLAIDETGKMVKADAPEGTVVVDGALSDESTNAVQNKVIKAALDELQDDYATKEYVSPLYTSNVPSVSSRTGLYTRYSDGSQIGTGSYFSQKIIKYPTFSYIKVNGVCNDDVLAVIGFYNNADTYNSSTYISGVDFIASQSLKTYIVKVPTGCQAIVCTSRNDVVPLGEDWVQCSNDVAQNEVTTDEEVELLAESGSENSTTFSAQKGTLLKVVISEFNFTSPILMQVLVKDNADLPYNERITGTGTYYIQVQYDVRGVYVADTSGNITYSIYRVKNLLNQYPVNPDIRDFSQNKGSFTNLDFLDLLGVEIGSSTNDSNNVLTYIGGAIRAENHIPLSYSDGKVTVTFNDTNSVWRFDVKCIAKSKDGNKYIASDSGWQTSNYTGTIQRNGEIAITVSKRNDSNFSISDIPRGLITLSSNDLKKNIIDGFETEKRIAVLEEFDENNELNIQKGAVNTEKNIFGENKQYSHIFIEDIYDDSNPTIPCQSAYDLGIAKRLGFKIAEANIAATSTSGKYVVMHTVNGTIGGQLVNLDGTSAASVVVNQTSFDDLRNNYKYKSIYTKYQTKIISLEEWCMQCKMLGLMPLVYYYDDTSLNIVKSYFGSDFILYNGTRNVHKGMIMYYSLTMTEQQLIEKCEQYKAPLMLNVADLSNFATDDDLIDAIKEVHKRGCLFGIAGCYMSGADAIRAYKCGADFSVSNNEVNPFDNGDIYNIDGELTFDGFTTTGSIANNVISLNSGQTITVPASNETPFLHAAQVEIVFDGSITIDLSGKTNATNISSNGEQVIRWSSFAVNTAPYMTITATASTTVKSLKYQAKKM